MFKIVVLQEYMIEDEKLIPIFGVADDSGIISLHDTLEIALEKKAELEADNSPSLEF